MRQTISLSSILITVCFFVVNFCTAQTVINSAGGDVRNETASVSWSLGQTFYNINEGVQHPYEIMIITGIDDMKAISLNIAVYPNPTSDFLELKINEQEFDYKTGYYLISDINGKLLKSEKINDAFTLISMEKYPKGIYTVEIKTNNKTVSTFKIIKNR